MTNIILEIIVLLLLICIITLIVIQIRKTYNINNLLQDTNDILENFNNISEGFSSSPDISGNCNEACKPYMNLSSKLDMLEKDYNTEKIIIENDRALLNKIKDKVNKLLVATNNPPL